MVIIILSITLIVTSAVYMVSLNKLVNRVERDEKRYQLGVQMAVESARSNFNKQLNVVSEELKAKVVQAESDGFKKGRQFAFDWLQSQVEAGEMEVKLLPKQ